MDLRMKAKSIATACGNNNKQFCSRHRRHQQMDGKDGHCKVVAKERSEHYALMHNANISQLRREPGWKNEDYLRDKSKWAKKVKRKRGWADIPEECVD